MLKTKKPKKRTRGKLLIECDKLFRKTILRDRPYQCEWCGKTNNSLQISHILPKGAYPCLRYEPANVLLLCFYCHFQRWHKSPLEAEEFLSSYKFPEYYEFLYNLSREVPMLKNFQIEMYIDCFKNDLDK